MPGFLTRDQELITRKVTPGTPRLALTETPERRCEMDDGSVRERKRKRERDVKSQSAWEIRGDEERERAEKEKRGTSTYKRQEMADSERH